MPAAKKTTPPPSTGPHVLHDSWLPQFREAVEGGAATQYLVTGNVHETWVSSLSTDPGKPRMVDLVTLLAEEVFAGINVVFHIDVTGQVSILKGAEQVAKFLEGRGRNLLAECPDFDEAVTEFNSVWRDSAAFIGAGPKAIFVELPQRINEQTALLLTSWSLPGMHLESSLVSALIASFGGACLPAEIRENRLAQSVKVPYPRKTELEALSKLLGREVDPSANSELGSNLFHAYRTGGTNAERPEVPKETALVGHEEVRTHLRQDLELWMSGDLKAIPPYYLLCGPRGTGKKSIVQALAGHFDLPVFIPEQQYTLASRVRPFYFDSWLDQVAAQERGIILFPDCERLPGFGLAPTDAQLGLAAEIQHELREFVKKDKSRRFLIFATSSRPDLLVPFTLLTEGEDYRLPLFPTSHTHEGFRLLQAILKQRFELELPDTDYYTVEENIPWLLTAAEALILATKTYRLVKLKSAPVAKAFNRAAKEHHSPLENKVLEHQIRVAIEESSEPGFVPDLIRNHFVAQ